MANLLKNLLGTLTQGKKKPGPTDVEKVNFPVKGSWAVTNSTYSMCDMVATVNVQTFDGNAFCAVIGELQTLSYSIHQEKAPVRNIGNVNSKDWVMGPRTVAGSLVFAVFNHHWTENIYEQAKAAGMKNDMFITDELPPIDIVCSFMNEYGFESYLCLYGVRIINEGQVMSTNDVYIENTYQFVANSIQLLKASSDPVTSKARQKNMFEVTVKTEAETKAEHTVIAPIEAKETQKDATEKNDNIIIGDSNKAFSDWLIVNASSQGFGAGINI